MFPNLPLERWFAVRTRSGNIYEVWGSGNCPQEIRSAHRAPIPIWDFDARMGEPLVGWREGRVIKTSPIVELIPEELSEPIPFVTLH